MIKVYIGKKIDGISHIPELYPNLGYQNKKTNLFINKVFKHFKDPVFEIVENIEYAEYILIPHNPYMVEYKREYLNEFIKLSKKFNKKILTFNNWDSDSYIDIPNSINFRTSQYGYKKKENEVIIPPYVEDLSYHGEIELKHKGEKPIVGFCGWAEFCNLSQIVKYFIKKALIDIQSISKGKKIKVHKKGLYYRRSSIKILKNSKDVKTNFLIRKSFSGHTSTIELSPELARRQYVQNILDSDFILCVKGDGNFSLRFFEALSAGRIPLLVDTDCVLPLEDVINYDEFIFRVDYNNIYKIDKELIKFYDEMSDENFIEMQKMARDTFKKYLRVDSFLNNISDKLKTMV